MIFFYHPIIQEFFFNSKMATAYMCHLQVNKAALENNNKAENA